MFSYTYTVNIYRYKAIGTNATSSVILYTGKCISPCLEILQLLQGILQGLDIGLITCRSYRISRQGLIIYRYTELHCMLHQPNMALWPTSDFDPKRISKIYNIKTLCNYEMRCFYQTNYFICDFVAILNHFFYHVCYRDENIRKHILIRLIF